MSLVTLLTSLSLLRCQPLTFQPECNELDDPRAHCGPVMRPPSDAAAPLPFLSRPKFVSESSLQPIVCCLGEPIAGNPMQLLMERAFAAAGLDWRFLSLEVPTERFEDAIKGIRALGFRGAAFTTPHQVAAAKSLDRLSVTAELVGAVNCAVRRDGVWLGENTDGQGFVDSLSPEFEMAGKRVLVIGAGGTARAIAVAIAQRGPAEVLILNRSSDHGESLASLLKERLAVPATYIPWSGRYRVPEDIGLLVHAT